MPTHLPFQQLPAVRRQHLKIEYATLKHAHPAGVYVIPTPNDPMLWLGYLFVQKGPYASAVLQFEILFPPTYPTLPPIITFTTDIFHPMLTPLTTYTYTTGSSENETVSATDEERLPPGGLSLRHGFPHWFRRSQRSAPTSAASSRNVSSSLGTEQESRQQESQEGWNGSARLYTSEQDLHSPLPPASRGVAGPNITLHPKRRKDVSTLEVLRYIKQSFDDETLLDSLPLDAAGNPGAWHAWRSHRMKTRHIPRPSPSLPLDDNESSDAGSEETLSVGYQHSAGSTSADRARRPGEWNWEGVWEDRVRRGIEGSRSEAVLYGSAGETSDLIRFLNVDKSRIRSINEDIRRSLEHKAWY